MRQQSNMPSSVISSHSMHLGVLATASHAIATGTLFSVFYKPRFVSFSFRKVSSGVLTKANRIMRHGDKSVNKFCKIGKKQISQICIQNFKEVNYLDEGVSMLVYSSSGIYVEPWKLRRIKRKLDL